MPSIPPFTMPGKKQAVFFTTLQAWCYPLLTDVIESSQKNISYPFAPFSLSSPHNSGVWLYTSIDREDLYLANIIHI